MHRREVSANELAKIVSLRQNNFSWLKIEEETTVPRRIAQRAYRDWEHTQASDEFKVAHQTVAAEELRKHLDSLKKLAFDLVRHFDIPRPSRQPQSAREFLKSLLERDIASEYGAYGFSGLGRDKYLISTTDSYPVDVRYRQNQMLLRSLQEHTDHKLTLSDWESAYDTCRGHQAKLLAELDQILPIVLNLHPELKRAEAIASKEKKIIRQMADGLTHFLWEGILAGKVELEELVTKIKILGGGERRVELAFGNLASPTVIVPDDVGSQAREVCIGVITNLLARREEIIDPLLKDVEKMRGVNDDLAKILNPLTLVPNILHSKCALCPC
ncbi:hypothetical protein ES703_29682 [subsurface metagenome]